MQLAHHVIPVEIDVLASEVSPHVFAVDVVEGAAESIRTGTGEPYKDPGQDGSRPARKPSDAGHFRLEHASNCGQQVGRRRVVGALAGGAARRSGPA